MQKHKTIISQFSALLFLVLILQASFFSVYHPKNTTQVSKIATEKNTDNHTATYSESVPFDAVVSVGLQCEFHKIVFVAIPQLVISYITLLKEPVKQTFQSVFLLSYFQNLFKTSILINAP